MQHQDRSLFESDPSGDAFETWVGRALKSRYEAVLHEILPPSIIQALPLDILGHKARPPL